MLLGENEEREPVYFVWQLGRSAIYCARYRGKPFGELAKSIVATHKLSLAEEALSLGELSAKYPYSSES